MIVITAALLPAILLGLYNWKKGPLPESTSWLRLNYGVVKEMAGYRHTPTCCLSKLRSSLEAGKKQPRVWVEYARRVAEVPFDVER